MKRALVLVALLSGCGFALRHPAVGAGIFGGSVGFLGCEIDSVNIKTCGVISASTAVFLGGVVALVNLIANTSEPEPAPDQEVLPSGALRVRTHTAPPPIAIDAGVADSPIADAALTD